jgi:hypothetical protein
MGSVHAFAVSSRQTFVSKVGVNWRMTTTTTTSRQHHQQQQQSALHRLNMASDQQQQEEEKASSSSSSSSVVSIKSGEKDLVYDEITGRFYEAGKEEIECLPDEEYCVIDKESGQLIRLTVQEKERIFLDALQVCTSVCDSV